MTGNAIREALEPFAKVASWLAPDVSDDATEWPEYMAFATGAGPVPAMPTVGDLRRARTAYDAIGSDPANIDYEWEAKTAWNCQADDANQWDSLGADEKEGLKAVVAFAIGRGRSFAHRDAIGSGVKAPDTVLAKTRAALDRMVALYEGEFDPETIPPRPDWLAAALSTHTAAGAGPMGEAVAWRVRRFGNVAWFLTFAPDNYSAKTHEKEPLYVRPVEEPGEVERLRAALAEEREVVRAIVAAAGDRPEDQDIIQHVRTLAETRKRLEKRANALEATLDRFLNEPPGFVVPLWIRTAARRALTGDAQTDGGFLTKGERAAIDKLGEATALRRELAETLERLEKVSDGNRTLPYGRDELGRFVREAWVRWAETQPNPKPSWLLAYDELPEPDKEADRQIGEAIARWTLIGDAARAALTGEAQEAGR